jgi:hypothetical protein
VADRGGSWQAMDEIGPGKGVRDVTQVTLGVKALTIEGGDAAGLLPAVLQGVQAQRDDGRGVWNAEDPEDTALEPQRVVARISHGSVKAPVGKRDCHRDFSTITSSDLRSRRL